MNTDITGMVSDIQKFSLHDGPGIRTTIFLKGCPIKCEWCHNPESLSFDEEIAFAPNNCIGCKACFSACKTGALTFNFNKRTFDKSKCTTCGKCISICPGGAMYRIGKKMSALEVYEILAADLPYYKNSGGGVTISGGEPLAQADFSAAILFLAKEAGLGTAIETSLYQGYEKIQVLYPVTDLFYCDLKLIDNQAHKKYTGADNSLILENVKRLYGEGKKLVIHLPLVPGITDSKENICGIAEWIKQNIPGTQLELLNYNLLARAKWENLDMIYSPGDIKPSKEAEVKELAGLAEKAGVRTRYRMG